VNLSFLASQFTTVVLFGQSAGLYQHYVSTFPQPHRSAVVIPAGSANGADDPAGARLRL
jgi:hypothetical protein